MPDEILCEILNKKRRRLAGNIRQDSGKVTSRALKPAAGADGIKASE